MADYKIISDVSEYLLHFVQKAVCPNLLKYPEQVALCAPDTNDNEALFCIDLYSIRDFSSYNPQLSMVGKLPVCISLAYVLFVNSSAQTPLDTSTAHKLFGRVIEAVCQSPVISIEQINEGASFDDKPASISFQKLEDRQKQELWSGFSQPMRAAVYLEIGPLLLGESFLPAPRVREFEGRLVKR